MGKRCFFIAFLLLFLTINAFAWVYPEHRYIALLTIKNLNPTHKQQLDELWKLARTGYENRLSAGVAEADQALSSAQLDYAAWTAIGGDHSYSAQNLLHNVLETDWIINVSRIAAQLRLDIVNAKTQSQHNNALRGSDIKLLRADLEYISRAGSNNAHFLLPRENADLNIDNYIAECIGNGADLNALGLYALFHKSALLKASRYNISDLSVPEKAALIRASLADEAFALHFLQDVFAAGHTTGSWGNSALRKGTHDYYNEKGLEVTLWGGKRSVIMGDAYITENNAETAAMTCRLSLEELLSVTFGQKKINNIGSDPRRSAEPNDFNISQTNYMPDGSYDLDFLKTVVLQTPMPGLKAGLGETPRFRAELGKF